MEFAKAQFKTFLTMLITLKIHLTKLEEEVPLIEKIIPRAVTYIPILHLVFEKMGLVEMKLCLEKK